MKILCRIRALRKEKNLTQEELADKLGISRQSIISVESGKSLPSLSLALSISELFNKAIEEIFNPNSPMLKMDRKSPFAKAMGGREVFMNRDLMPWRPFGLGRFFDEDWGEADWPRSVTITAPQVDVYEKGDKVIVEAQLPGINSDDVKIDISDNVLKISGEKKEEKEEKEKNFYRREISYGSFARSIALPANVDTNSADAEYADGMLKIIMPKLAVKESKSVKIKVKKK